MADVKLEAELAQATFAEIASATDAPEAIASAFDGLSQQLLAILLELRDAREDTADHA